MKLTETIILYAPKKHSDPIIAGRMKLFSYPGDWGREQWHSTGACYRHVHKMTDEQKTRFLFILAMLLIIRDGIDPETVHNTLCEIREYRDGLAYDTPVPEHLRGLFSREAGI